MTYPLQFIQASYLLLQDCQSSSMFSLAWGSGRPDQMYMKNNHNLRPHFMSLCQVFTKVCNVFQ